MGSVPVFHLCMKLICRSKKKAVNKGHGGRTVTFIEKYAKSYIVNVVS